jgi:hypothetical protein
MGDIAKPDGAGPMVPSGLFHPIESDSIFLDRIFSRLFSPELFGCNNNSTRSSLMR